MSDILLSPQNLSRRLFLGAGTATAVFGALSTAVAAAASTPDSLIFELIAEMERIDAAVNASDPEDECDELGERYNAVFQAFTRSKPQTAKGARAALGRLVAEMRHSNFDSGEIRPLLEAIMNIPALQA